MVEESETYKVIWSLIKGNGLAIASAWGFNYRWESWQQMGRRKSAAFKDILFLGHKRIFPKQPLFLHVKV